MSSSSSDPRRDYLVSALRAFLLSASGPAPDAASLTHHVSSSPAVALFLDSPAVQLLQFHFEAGQILSANQIATDKPQVNSSSSSAVQFLKRAVGPLVSADISSQLQVNSSHDSPAASLFLQLHHIYSPQFSQSAVLQSQLRTLESLLKSSALQADSDSHSINAIQSLKDEHDYWVGLHHSDFSELTGKLLSSSLAISLSAENSSSSDSIISFLDDFDHYSDELFVCDPSSGPRYPAVRMRNLFGLVGSLLVSWVRVCFSVSDEIKFWSAPITRVKQKVESSLSVFRHWQLIIDELTESHEWKARWNKELAKESSESIDSYSAVQRSISSLKSRFVGLLRYRSLHDDVENLLSTSELINFQFSSLFQLFDSADFLLLDSFHSDQFDQRIAQFNEKFRAIENHAAKLLKNRFQQFADKPALLLNEFRKFQSLLLRPAVANSLENERKILLQSLQSQLELLDSTGSAESHNSHLARNFSPFLQRLLFLHSQRDKAEQMRSLVDAIFPEGENSLADRFLTHCSDFLHRVEDSARDSFDRWHLTQLSALEKNNSPLSLQTAGKLMELDLKGAGELKVHYSEELVKLVREVRTASELGYKIDSKIREAVITGDKFYRYGIKLNQIANFYNSMADQILPSQLGMLMHEAENFERIVKDQNQNQAAKWNNIDECEKYMKRLSLAAEQLTTRNRKLRSMHHTVGSELTSLAGVDILRGRDHFLEIVSRVKNLISREEKNNSAAAIRVWRSHWDSQLWKILNFQYRVLLEQLSDSIGLEIPVDICVMKRKLALRPNIEDLRTNYYRQLKKWLDFPKSFVGFSAEENSIFSSIPARHAKEILALFQSVESLFNQLNSLVANNSSWGLLFQMQDLDSFVESRLSTTSDFEYNFRILKLKRKEAEKLPDSHRIGCFTVSLVPMKTSIDDQIHRFTESLLVALKKTAGQSIRSVDQFLSDSMKILSTPPASIDELSAAKAKWNRIAETRNDFDQKLKELVERDNLLKSMVNISLDIGPLKSRFHEFSVQFQAFEYLLSEQKENLKVELERKLNSQQLATEQFNSRWQARKPSVDPNELSGAAAERIVDEMKAWVEELHVIRAQCVGCCDQAGQFDLPIPVFEVLDRAEAEIESQQQSWAFFSEFRSELDSMSTEDWFSFRVRISSFDDFCNNWTKKLKSRGSRDVVFELLVKEIKNYREIWPTLRKVTGEFFEKQHWKLLFSIIQLPSSVQLSNLTLGTFLSRVDLFLQKGKEISNLAARAQGEVSIRDAVEELKVWAEKSEFSLLEHATGVSLIKDWKDLFTSVSDQTSLVSSLKESPYFEPFADVARQFEEKFSLLDEVLQELNGIQRKWTYLQPIFSRGNLPSEQARFKRIDSEFRSIMNEIKENRTLMTLVGIPQIKETVVSLSSQLERCQRALNDFLELKRSKFPRFYFLGDEDLLEILGQSQNPLVIQNHLKKLFAGIHSVEFGKENQTITAMVSSEKEFVKLSQPVKISAEVEIWLKELTESMELTLVNLLIDCVGEFDINRFPSQILNLAESISFTDRVERIFASGSASTGFPQLQRQLTDQLNSFTEFDAGDDRLLKTKLKSLILDLIHHLDVVKQLQDGKVNNSDNWIWQKQLRYYMNSQKRAVCKMADAEFPYSYEYVGIIDKQVHTPLTDKCYLVLTQGMHLGYGGCPYGPAGTGKTESVKALANAFGRLCLVFNCDSSLDAQAMGRIFTGLVQCGAWGCFDEFNRLMEDQLSAVSQQIQLIQAALKRREPTCILLNSPIPVNFNSAIFVTMNPASREYGGRSKLPHNLKQLFRDVAMSAPDIGQITEVILYSEGFAHAKLLAKKVVETFELSKQLLSNQRHYDFGLRSLKTLLRHAGQLIADEKKKSKQTVSMERETTLIIGALKMNTLSKLTFADSVRFNGLISDVFPRAALEEVDYKELEIAIRKSLEELKLEVVEKQIKKILQLYEATQQRMGVLIVGPSGCGKSVMLSVLHHALQSLGQPIVRHVMNPKALERSKLLGSMDLDTREFIDGVLTAASRQVMKEPSGVHSWIICDGDVDPEWIESLNSVLDDNHLLTMPNGERIKFGSNVNFLFETANLEFASPATVSRMGMIFLSEEDVDIRSLVNGWIRKQDEKIQAKLAGWLDELFYQGMKFVQENFDEIVKRTRVGLVQTALSQLRNCFTRGEFLVGLIRGLGSNISQSDQLQFAKQILIWSNEKVNANNLLDLYYDPNAAKFFTFAPQEQEIPIDALSLNRPPVVRTVDVQRTVALISPWMAAGEPFLLVGPEGCGKSLILENTFSSMKGANFTILNCSAQTKARHVLQKLNENCAVYSTAKGRVYRPKEGERLILFLKDINLPKPDKYDTIELIAFLQQLVTHKGFYDESLDWTHIEKIQIIGTMNPVTGIGRHQISARFTATVHVAAMNYPDKDQLQIIYTSYLRTILNSQPLSDDSMKTDGAIKKLCSVMIDVYDRTRAKFSPDEQRHYLFNPRDLTGWAFGLLRFDLRKENILDLIAFEAHRLFADRIISPEGRRVFEQILNTAMRNVWKFEPKLNEIYFTSMAAAFGSMAADSAGANSVSESEEKFGRDFGPQLDRVGSSDFRDMIVEGLRTYEREFKSLRMLLFSEILDHLAFEDRILSRPGGSLLLVGSSGVGRRSSVTLICHMKQYFFYSPQINLKYEMKSFRIELKELIKKAGVEGQKVCFYVEDHQLILSGMLEDLNSLLSGGEIPGLYQANELDPLLAPLKEQFQSSGFACKNVYEFFISRVRANLHIVLSLEPNNSQFAVRLESNPAILSRCSCIWMGKWSREGLTAVPAMKLQALLNSPLSTGQLVDQSKLLDSIVSLHQSRNASPLKFCAFLDTYQTLFESKQSKLQEQKKHLSAGLSKLTEAANSVDILSKDAAQKQAAVSKKQREADDALDQITVRMSQAGERKSETEQLQKSLGAEEAKLNVKKVAIQGELKEIQPILDQAKSAVGGIKKDHINEIRAFRMPPNIIRAVLEGVLGLMKQEDLSWDSMKKFLASPNVKEQIMNFDAAAVDRNTRQKVEAVMKANPDSFNDAKIAHANMAAAPLSTWVRAVIRYSAVAETVKPLQDSFDEATRQLDGARIRLKQCEAELSAIDSDVKQLKEKFSRTTGEAESLKQALARTNEILGSASSLLGKLSGEQKRWDAQVKSLSADLDSLIYQALIAAAFINYLGGSAEDARALVMKDWLSRMNLKDFNIQTFLSNESEFLNWKSEGLPADELSQQNGLVINYSKQSPFILDPNGAALNWLLNHLKSSGANKSVEIVMQQDNRFVNILELAVRFGKTLLITEVDGVLPMIYPLLRQDLVRQGPRSVVQIGDKSIDFNENFKVFLLSRNPNVDLNADDRALVNIVNFTVTRSGLEGQLLSMALNRERPELEQRKSQLLASEESFKLKLAELEKSLLNELADSSGNILENKSLIDSLNKTKSQSMEIHESLAAANEIQHDLDLQRETFRSIAHSGSLLFFLCQQLRGVNNMYDFSLPAFLKIFNSTLETKTDTNNDERVKSLVSALRSSVFLFVSRTLFKSDRLMFAIHLVHTMFPDRFTEQEWGFFTDSLVNSDESNSSASSPSLIPQWATKCASPALYSSFASLFPGLVRSFRLSDDSLWSRWNNSARPENEFPTIAGERSISQFQKLLLIKLFRPDRMQSAMQNFACDALGLANLSPPPLVLQSVVDQSSAFEPILFLCEGGADPTAELEDFVNRTIGREKFHQIALGSGQTDIAIEAVGKAADSGHWILLKNTHLVTAWLPQLEKLLQSFHHRKVHSQFRLWLTTESHPLYPPVLLQQTLKISYEAPPGVKQNLLRTYSQWDADYIARGSVLRSQLLFILAWFHAIVQERRTYIPQGWTKFYEFSAADIRSGADIIDNISKKDRTKPGAQIDAAAAESFPWTSIWGLLKFAIYGGRIDNDQDVRVLVTYLRKFFHKDILSVDGQTGQRKLTQGIELPASSRHEDYLSIIRRLPEHDSPNIFSLPENIQGSVQQQIGDSVIAQLKKLSISSSVLSRFDREAWTNQLSPLLTLWDSLSNVKSQPLVLGKPMKLSKPPEEFSPIEAFIVNENHSVTALIKLIQHALASLSGVLYQSEPLNNLIVNDVQSLLSGIVPWRWAQHWLGPLEPLQWIRELIKRRLAICSWMQKCESTQGKNLFATPIQLANFLNPKTFFNAFRQQTARETGKPIDQLKLAVTWNEALFTSAAAIRVQLDGLVLQGCGFAGSLLSPIAVDSSAVSSIPVCSIAFIPSSDSDPYPEPGSNLSVPVYNSPTREEFIGEFKVPCKGQLDRWILTGVAIFLTDHK